jgi:hypothetical protein
MVMIGALSQLAPVAAGEPLPGIVMTGRPSYALLLAGMLFLLGFAV